VNVSSAANQGRVVAARALCAVEQGLHVEDFLGDQAPTNPKDRALAWYLALGTLRERGMVDAAIRGRLRQPISALDEEVRAVLRVATFEKLYARTQDHAVVHQAVEVVRALGKGRAQGLVNAVVRHVAVHKNPKRADRLNHPHWLVDRWTERFGESPVDKWCAKNNTLPPLTVVINGSPEAVIQAWQDAGLKASPVEYQGDHVKDVYRLEGHQGHPADLPGFSDGHFWMQDVASVLAADFVQASAQDRVLDACAAPGGKTFRLMSTGATVTAVDRSENRMSRLYDSAKRLGIQPQIRLHDWRDGMLKGNRKWSRVLLDVPCTGLGTLRRHPEIRWRRSIVDVRKAASEQIQILRQVSSHVADGGVLVYSVCSPEPEEGEALIRSFLKENQHFRLDDQQCTAPPLDEEDAFYMARLVRH